MITDAAGVATLSPDAPAEVAARTLLGSYITDEELWACTSCRACVYECPVSHLRALRHQRTASQPLVLAESRFPEEMMPAFEAMETSGSPGRSTPATAASGPRG